MRLGFNSCMMGMMVSIGTRRHRTGMYMQPWHLFIRGCGGRSGRPSGYRGEEMVCSLRTQFMYQ